MNLRAGTLAAIICALWMSAVYPTPVAAFDAARQAPTDSQLAADRVAQNQIWVQFFEQNRRRNSQNPRGRNDLVPLRSDPGERQLRIREPRNQRQEQDAAREAVRRGEILPLGGIIRAVRRQCPGKFLGARLQRGRNGFAYQVRILRPSGQRIGLLVDAKSGAVVGGRCR